MRFVFWTVVLSLHLAVSTAESEDRSKDICCATNGATEVDELVFDIRDVGHRFEGFGTQVWAFNNAPSVDLRGKLVELNIQYVRLTRQGSLDQMRSLRTLTDELGIQWVYTVWSSPPRFADGARVLQDVPGFTQWWVEQVEGLRREKMTPHYIELMNEPDSMGHWSTGITPQDYNAAVKAIRRELDARGLASVGIVGPGLAHLDWDRHNATWIEALDSVAVSSLAAWSTHSWDDGDLCRGGASCIENQWTTFEQATDLKDASKPIFVTEYASKESTYHGVSYPKPESTRIGDSSYYSATNTVAYAVRLYENSLALLNSGANVPFVWQLVDEVSELNQLGKSWGLIDINGRPKPAYVAMSTLAPKLPVGARVVRAAKPSQGELYASTFVHGDDIVVAIANGGDAPQWSTVRLANTYGQFDIASATAFELDRRGDPAAGEPDVSRVTERRVNLAPGRALGEHTFVVSLPATSTLTVVLRRSETTGTRVTTLGTESDSMRDSRSQNYSN